jgi:hypothetical protein
MRERGREGERGGEGGRGVYIMDVATWGRQVSVGAWGRKGWRSRRVGVWHLSRSTGTGAAHGVVVSLMVPVFRFERSRAFVP